MAVLHQTVSREGYLHQKVSSSANTRLLFFPEIKIELLSKKQRHGNMTHMVYTEDTKTFGDNGVYY